MIKYSILISLLWLCLSCTNVGLVNGYANTNQCKFDEPCSLDGNLTLVEIDHVLMGRLVTKELSCINVSLPDSSIKKLSNEKKINAIVTGFLYKTSVLSEDDFNLEYRVNNRRVGWNQCFDVYLFVENNSDIVKIKPDQS